MINIKKKDYIYIIILVILSIGVYWRWIFNIDILSYGDWGFYFNSTAKEFFNIPFIWSTTSLGFTNITLVNYPYLLTIGILAHLNLNFAIIERILFCLPIIIITPVSSFLLIQKVTKSSIGAFLGSLVFTYNTYFLMLNTGQLTVFVADGLAPLAILAYISSLENRKIYTSILTGIILFILGAYEFRIFYIVSWILILYLGYYIVIVNKDFQVRSIIKYILLGLIPLAVIALLNFYWIIPLIYTHSITNNEIFNRTLFGNNLLKLNSSIALFHPFWTGGAYIPFKVQPIPAYLWIVPFFAFTGLFLNFKNRNVVFFGFIAIIGIFLTKQVDYPFPELYPYLYTHFPGFNAFREASKFYIFIALGYSILIGSFIAFIFNLKDIQKLYLKKNYTIFNLKYIKYSIVLIIVITTLYNTKPLLTAQLKALFITKHIPNDYIKLETFLSTQQDFSRTLWLPRTSRWSYFNNQHPAISEITEIGAKWMDLNYYKDTNTNSSYNLVSFLDRPYSQSLLNNFSIRYVIVPIKDTANQDDFFPDYKGSRSFYIDSLDKINYLKRVDIGTKDLVVYENIGFLNNSYITATYVDNHESEFNYNQKLELPNNVNQMSNYNDNYFLNSKNKCDIIGTCYLASIPITTNQKYIFSFKYKSDSNSNSPIDITINFNDKDKIKVNTNKIGYSEISIYIDKLIIPNLASEVQIKISSKYLIQLSDFIFTPYEEEQIQNTTYTKQDKNPKITYESINPTLKNIHLKNISAPFIINLSEFKDTNWYLYSNREGNSIFNIQDKNIITKISTSNNFLNSWYIDPIVLCKDKSICKLNPDQTYNIDLTAIYYPQKYVFIGGLISITALILLSLGLIFTSIRKI